MRYRLPGGFSVERAVALPAGLKFPLQRFFTESLAGSETLGFPIEPNRPQLRKSEKGGTWGRIENADFTGWENGAKGDFPYFQCFFWGFC